MCCKKMAEKERIKVVWLCQFSNPEVREHLKYRLPFIERIVRKLKHREFPPPADYCQWVTNAIREFEKFDDVELHVIAPVLKLSRREMRFALNGIHYYFYRDQSSSSLEFLRRIINAHYFCDYNKDRNYVKTLIREINPDIVHLFGAENLNNARCLLDVPQSIPTIVQLQTLLSSPDFKEGAGMTEDEFRERVKCEQTVIKAANYVGTGAKSFLPVIKNFIKQDVVALLMPLALAEMISISQEKKEYDFVYFARNINKAADWAIEAFAEACLLRSALTLHIIGFYSDDYKQILDERLQTLNISDKVVFEGELPTHEAVLNRIRKARVALLPLKVDLVSGTIREAMSNGIPVVSTITEGTPNLNKETETVLLSAKQDYAGMAVNMIKLLDDKPFATELATNAARLMQKKGDNYSRARASVEVYNACVNNFNHNISIPQHLIIK